jgi:hypothetical protein
LQSSTFGTLPSTADQTGQGPGVPPQAKQEAKRGVTHARGWLGDYANRTLHVTAFKIAFNLIKNRVIIQALPQPVLLLAGFEDPPGEFQAFGFDPIALFSGTLLELRVVESA